MMKDETEQFERRLSRQPLRPIPQEWRAEILSAAKDATAVRHAARGPQQSLFSTLTHRLSALLWPHPRAWAGLAAVWVVIFAVYFSTRDSSPTVTAKSVPPSPDVIVELKKQQRMFAELVGTYEAPDADQRKVFSPKPRSERMEVLMA